MLKLQTEAISSLGFNIASGIILEQLIEKQAKKLPIYFNAKTLYRNYIACLEGNVDDKVKQLKSNITSRPIIADFIDDTKLLVNSFMEAGYEVYIYDIDYKPFLKTVSTVRDPSMFRGAKLVVRKTEPDAISKLSESFKGIFIETKPKFKFVKEYYIVTHIGIDLLNISGNRNVTLVESHTGALKDHTKWYNKYAKIGSNRMDVFPLVEWLYKILGDSDYVTPSEIRIRKYLYDVAIKNNWYGDLTEHEVVAMFKKVSPMLARKFNTEYKQYFK